MDQAKAIINLKEGVVQLEGPVEFVREYLERFATKGQQGMPKEIQVTPKRKAAKGREKAVPRPRRAKRRGRGRTTCTDAVRAEVDGGFFNEARATQEIKQHLAEKGLSYSYNSIRLSLKQLVARALLVRSGAGPAVRYLHSG